MQNSSSTTSLPDYGGYSIAGCTDVPPAVQDMAVITCHFNWQGFQRPRQNLQRFLRHMGAHRIPVYGVEAVLPGQPAQTAGMNGWRQVNANRHCLLFQKEALLNLAEKLVPERFTKIVWVDADVHFTNPHWAEITSSLLDSAAVVQPFYLAVWTDHQGHAAFRRQSVAWARSADPLRGHPGFAMAARRSLFQACGLWDGAICGGGDVRFITAVSGSVPSASSLQALGVNRAPYERWSAKARAWMQANGGLILAARGELVHEWHGDRKDRQYAERTKLTAALDLDKHVARNADGLWQWTPDAPPEMMAAVAAYFADRKEDG